MSPVDCVEVSIDDIMRVVEPAAHAFGSNGAENDNVAERDDRGRGGEERRREERVANTKRGIGPDRAPDLKLSEKCRARKVILEGPQRYLRKKLKSLKVSPLASTFRASLRASLS